MADFFFLFGTEPLSYNNNKNRSEITTKRYKRGVQMKKRKLTKQEKEVVGWWSESGPEIAQATKSKPILRPQSERNKGKVILVEQWAEKELTCYVYS